MAPDLFGLDLDVVVGVVVVDELPDDIGEAVLGELEEGAEVGLPCCCGGLDGLLQGGRSRSGGHGGRSSITSNTTRNMRRVVLGLGLRFTLRRFRTEGILYLLLHAARNAKDRKKPEQILLQEPEQEDMDIAAKHPHQLFTMYPLFPAAFLPVLHAAKPYSLGNACLHTMLGSFQAPIFPVVPLLKFKPIKF